MKPYIKVAEAMLTRVEVERLPSYELGMEKGMEQGDYRARCRIARSLFGILPDTVIAEKTGLTPEQLERLKGLD